MIRSALQHIDGLALFPVLGLILFLAVFIGMTVYALRLRGAHIEHMGHLPLEDDVTAAKKDNRHE
jgi:cytochrome c oxidase cbb3-type subunit 3